MELSEALEIVSYKLGQKKGDEALEDPVLLPEVVKSAISDKESDSSREIDAKSYMAATKVVNEYRIEYTKIEGVKWLLENGAKDGVEKTESGLQYRIVKEGEGPLCPESATAEVNYEGTLIDGSVFDSSFERGEPASFPVKAVIKGWQEGLQLMKAGSEFQFFIPQELGYGERGAGSDIPPCSVLIFDVHLLSFD